MKKKLVLPALAGVLLAAVALGGCGTIQTIVVDEMVPEADTAVVYSYSFEKHVMDGVLLTLKLLDGGPLPPGFKKGSPLRVPAGEHTFTADGKWFSGLTIVRSGGMAGPSSTRQYFSQKDIQFTYDFKEGVSYYLEMVLTGGEGANVIVPPLVGAFTGPQRVGGEPFIGQIAVYAVDEYDKYLSPYVSDDMLIEVIRFDQEVSF